MSIIKKIAIGLAIVFVSFLLYVFYFHTQQPFEQIDLTDNPNEVYNYSSVSYADTVAHVALQILNIEGVSINILNIPMEIQANFYLDNRQVNGFVTNDIYNIYNIFMDHNMSRSNYMKIMGHEIIHIQQVHENRLNISAHPIIIYEDFIYDIYRIPYLLRPWEVEAYVRQDSVYQEIKNILLP